MIASHEEKKQSVEEMQRLLDWFVEHGALYAGVSVTYPNGDRLQLESAVQIEFPLKASSV